MRGSKSVIPVFMGVHYTIVGVVWVDPFPGYMTWSIERLLDPSTDDVSRRIETMKIEWIMEHGLVTERDGNFYQGRTVADDGITRLDDPPTWDEVDRLKAQIFILNEALKLKYQQAGKKRNS